MAGPAQLVQIVSEVTGVPLPTVVDIDRRLAKAQLRSKTGRGRNAARMTPLDAARLLTAILASAQANEAVEAVQRYAGTTASGTGLQTGFTGRTELYGLSALPAKHSFIDALSALIAAVSRDSFAGRTKTPGNHGLHLEVCSVTQATWGQIRIKDVTVDYSPARLADPRMVAEATSNLSMNPGDLEQSRRVTGRTILAISNLLVKES